MKERDVPIRMVVINGGDVYINRDDVIKLLKLAACQASSLNSKSDINGIVEDLSEGIEDHNEREEHVK